MSSGCAVEPKTHDGSCNALLPKLKHIPAKNRSIVLTNPDNHGRPALTAPHGVCANAYSGNRRWTLYAYDWGFCWRSFDALRSCALTDQLCRYALGNTPENRYIGTWSDGTPIRGLKIQTAAPIRAKPLPARAAKPRPRRRT